MVMHSLNVVSKSVAMKIKLNHTNTKIMKYCNGKYEWYGSAKHYIGKEVDVSPNVLAVFIERRQDRHGPYARMMCVVQTS